MNLRLEYHSDQENSHKFWMVKPNGKNSWQISWGRVGSTGQSQYIDTQEAAKRVREKLKKGYRIHDSSVLDGPIQQLFPFGMDGVKVAQTVQKQKAQKIEKTEKKEKKEKKKEEKDLWDILVNS